MPLALVKQLSDLDLAGRRVLVRVDFNVPLDGDRITDDTRIRGALPTIRAILDAGGTPVLMSHLGRPRGGPDPAYSLRPVAARLEQLLGAPVVFCDETVGEAAERCVAEAPRGAAVLLENTRFLPGETENDDALAQQLARLGDVFVSDAFGSVHRAHASTEGVARHVRDRAAGHLLARELDFLARALDAPRRPLVAVVGGAKVSDKIGVVEALLERADRVLVGGAMAYTFLAALGHATGDSLVEADRTDEAFRLYERAGGKLLLPHDHVVADRFAPDAERRVVTGEIPDGWMGLDIGPATRAQYAAEIGSAGTVIWNGPMGVFEMAPFAEGTLAVAKALAEATRTREALTIVGGGDSVAALAQAGLEEAVSHVSTGGGAMLEFLEGKTLPGVAVLG
ncbi:MAG: phosphoglycerate kinase [Rubricoccaceae bacterium]